MRIAIVGTGYVGLVVGACLAETGNEVTCADVDTAKIAALSRVEIPIYEPGLEPLVRRNLDEGRLKFTGDVAGAIESAQVVFIAVGTPPQDDGAADLMHVLAVARLIGSHMNDTKIVVTKSTVPVRTSELVRDAIAKETDVPFHVCSNPEFLKEGDAVADFMKPDRIVVGADSAEAASVLEQLFAPFVRTGNPIIVMDNISAEMTKYAANAMLASRVSLMNQFAELCEAVGADVSLVRRGIGSDRRIGSAYLFPGPGYGGSCLPKDVSALIRIGIEQGVSMSVLKAVQDANTRQRKRLFEKVHAALDGDLGGRTIAVWGLAFKAETDDIRESPAIDLVESLLASEATVNVFDAHAMASARLVLGDRVNWSSDPFIALDGADALVIATEWLAFRNPDFGRMRALMRNPLVVDGRNLFDPETMAGLGFTYIGVGRGTTP